MFGWLLAFFNRPTVEDELAARRRARLAAEIEAQRKEAERRQEAHEAGQARIINRQFAADKMDRNRSYGRVSASPELKPGRPVYAEDRAANPMADPMHPLSPMSPISVYNSGASDSGHSRGHCSPSDHGGVGGGYSGGSDSGGSCGGSSDGGGGGGGGD